MKKQIALGNIAAFLSIFFIVWLLLMVQGCMPPPTVGVRSSTGKELDRGLEIICKVGTKYPDLQDSNHAKGWRDGQIVDVRPLGFHTGNMARKHFCVIEFPNIDYWTLRGDTTWKSTRQSALNLKKFLCVKDASNKYEWEAGFSEKKERIRDYFVDYKRLLDIGLITQKQYDGIYNKEIDHPKIELTLDDCEVILKNEDVHTRLSAEKDQTASTIYSGTYSIGSGLDYATVTLFEADIGDPMTGDLIGEHNAEETSISADILFATATSGHLLKLTAQSGDEHNGATYGNGARVNFATYNEIKWSDSDLANVEVSNLAFDVSGAGNYALYLLSCGSTLAKLNRLLIKGDSNTIYGLRLDYAGVNLRVTNCTIYGIGNGGSDAAILLDAEFSGGGNTWAIYNNTCIKNYCGIYEGSTTPAGTITATNNLFQGNTTDWYDANSGITSGGYNITEDATSPDGSPYVSLNVHDATSSFVDYANDDYKLTTGGSDNGTIDDGDDLSGTFTDDIDGGVARDTWWIGAHELPVVGNGGAAKTGQVMQVRKRRR